MSPAQPRIAILATGSEDWIGGVQYIQNLLWSCHYGGLAGNLGSPTCVTLIARPDYLRLLPDELLHQHWLEVRVRPRRRSVLGRLLDWVWLLVQALGFDAIYPCPNWLGLFVRKRGIGWIPDFQHVHLPQFFSAKELRRRDNAFRRTLSRNAVVVVSSEDAREDAKAFLPTHKAHLEVLRFHVLPPALHLAVSAESLLQIYGLPKRYLLCANQFWAHKDHHTLFRALALAIRCCPDLHLVCTGRLVNSLNADFLETLLRDGSSSGALKHVSLLGFLPRSDQLGLLSTALAVVQPSLFEGWSTVVEDARALGRPLILSDLNVHREQAPEEAYFFRRGDYDDLAERLIEVWRRDWPERRSEQELREQAELRLHRMGQAFGSIIQEARR